MKFQLIFLALILSLAGISQKNNCGYSSKKINKEASFKQAKYLFKTAECYYENNSRKVSSGAKELYEKAIEVCKQIYLDSSNEKKKKACLLMIATSYIRLENHFKSEAYLRKYLIIDPENKEFQVWYVNILIIRGKSCDAVKHLENNKEYFDQEKFTQLLEAARNNCENK